MSAIKKTLYGNVDTTNILALSRLSAKKIVRCENGCIAITDESFKFLVQNNDNAIKLLNLVHGNQENWLSKLLKTINRLKDPFSFKWISETIENLLYENSEQQKANKDRMLNILIRLAKMLSSEFDYLEKIFDSAKQKAINFDSLFAILCKQHAWDQKTDKEKERTLSIVLLDIYEKREELNERLEELNKKAEAPNTVIKGLVESMVANYVKSATSQNTFAEDMILKLTLVVNKLTETFISFSKQRYPGYKKDDDCQKKLVCEIKDILSNALAESIYCVNNGDKSAIESLVKTVFVVIEELSSNYLNDIECDTREINALLYATLSHCADVCDSYTNHVSFCRFK